MKKIVINSGGSMKIKKINMKKAAVSCAAICLAGALCWKGSSITAWAAPTSGTVRQQQPLADKLAKRFAGLHRAAYHRFYIDEVYQFITHRIIFRCISTPIAWFDRHVVDGFFNFIAWGTHATSDEIRGLQSGRVQQYAYVFLLGALILILILIL